MDINLILITLFVIKHFFVDFVFQTPYMYLNKGIYGHPGGLLHSLEHTLVTAVILYSTVSLVVAITGACVDFLAHYHIDYSKVKINTLFKLKPDNSEWYWILLGLDQLLHMITYIVIINSLQV